MTAPATGPALRLGTRRSALAMTQSRHVAEALTAATGRPVELVEVTTEGDVSRAHLTQIGGTGVFAAALRRALLDGEVDFAVHSLKDLPTAPEPGLTLAAIPAREDPRDVLVARDGLTLGELPAGARIGTGSPRRAAQVLALGLGHELVPVRGNVDTRLSFVRDGELDAVILARAGLARLGRADEATEVLDPLQVLPAPGQGALAVECRADAVELIELLATLDHADTRAAVSAERALLAALEAGCTAPVGALAEVVESLDADGATTLELSLRAVVAAPDGSETLRRSASGPIESPEGLGGALAAELLEDGAAELVTAEVMTADHERPPSPALAPNPAEHSPERAS
ncbi:hydroxymethylbilane synthase [Angustibacter sp. Root456]|uniref:hydroxymethylbilane synthase n=1 Tax=Angustibacter sp. Root456 TaxID=1736539 RepID=UPI0006F8C44D|nr:hydroxymethylbilane synthase [Angustibacter sp. Root456]KQX66187.1 porphobilinogen deaminase [Angustibacter sp. Root456]